MLEDMWITPTVNIPGYVLEFVDNEGDTWERDGFDRFGEAMWRMRDKPYVRGRYADSLIEFCPLRITVVR